MGKPFKSVCSSYCCSVVGQNASSYIREQLSLLCYQHAERIQSFEYPLSRTREAGLTVYARLQGWGAIIFLNIFLRIVSHTVYGSCLRSVLALLLTNTLEVALKPQIRQSCPGHRHCPLRRTRGSDLAFQAVATTLLFIQRHHRFDDRSSNRTIDNLDGLAVLSRLLNSNNILPLPLGPDHLLPLSR